MKLAKITVFFQFLSRCQWCIDCAKLIVNRKVVTIRYYKREVGLSKLFAGRTSQLNFPFFQKFHKIRPKAYVQKVDSVVLTLPFEFGQKSKYFWVFFDHFWPVKIYLNVCWNSHRTDYVSAMTLKTLLFGGHLKMCMIEWYTLGKSKKHILYFFRICSQYYVLKVRYVVLLQN